MYLFHCLSNELHDFRRLVSELELVSVCTGRVVSFGILESTFISVELQLYVGAAAHPKSPKSYGGGRVRLVVSHHARARRGSNLSKQEPEE